MLRELTFPVGPAFCRSILNACISDHHKQLLLSCAEFLPLLVEGLLIDPQHPRQAIDATVRTRIQRDFAECMQQLSLFPPGCAALRAAPHVVDTLRQLCDRAFGDAAADCARGALMQLTNLSDDESGPARTAKLETSASQSHVMMSYQWDSQSTVKRIVAELKRRQYLVWLDVECMQGSIMDAMSAAIEGAAVVLYGVSERYKESANCRLELNYAVREEVDLIPLMMQENCAFCPLPDDGLSGWPWRSSRFSHLLDWLPLAFSRLRSSQLTRHTRCGAADDVAWLQTKPRAGWACSSASRCGTTSSPARWTRQPSS
jgi:hypothetical protein